MEVPSPWRFYHGFGYHDYDNFQNHIHGVIPNDCHLTNLVVQETFRNPEHLAHREEQAHHFIDFLQ